MLLKDKPDALPERDAPMPELLEDYKARRVRLMAETRELERLRQHVRSSAEREAAAIVTNARRNVRQVLLEARRELLVLVAQLQAVGCDTQPAHLSSPIEQSPTKLEAATEPPAVASEPFGTTDIASDARRDVREVLLEAQAELVALAEEARELRARIAKEHAPGPELFPQSAVGVADEPAPVTVFPREPREEADAEPHVEYTPLSAPPRVWIAVAAAVLFAVVGVALYVSSAGRSSAADQRVAQAIATNPLQPPQPAAKSETAAPTTVAATRAADPAVLSLTLDVRRPVWIRTTVDGQTDNGRTFDEGTKTTVTARQEIVMRAGDAGAVLVSVNGSEPRALGPDGRVVTRSFGNQAAAAQPRPSVVQTSAENASAPPTIGTETSPADVGTAGVGDGGAATASSLAEREILRETQRWFEAYFVGDAEGMFKVATPDFSLVDERRSDRQLPRPFPGADRGLQQIHIEVAGNGASMSARLTERTTVNGQVREYVSLVSGVWIRLDGRWRLTSVRFVDPSIVG